MRALDPRLLREAPPARRFLVAATVLAALSAAAIVALILTPVVLLYQTWTYWVFRARLGDPAAAEIRSPLDLLERSPLGRGRPDPGG